MSARWPLSTPAFAYRMHQLRAGVRTPFPRACTNPGGPSCREEGARCLCMERKQRIHNIAEVIAMTQRSPDLPLALNVPRWGPSILFHLPIFVFVCPVCGNRLASYERSIMADNPPTHGIDWLVANEEVPRELQRTLGYTHRIVSLCSSPCLAAWEAQHRR